MMDKILLDTSIIIDFLRQRDKASTVLFDLSKKDLDLYISLITHTELYAGKSVWETKKAQRELEVIMKGLRVLPLSKEVSKESGRLRAKYDIDLIDAIIAATAIAEEIPMATLNLKHFRKVSGLILY